MYCLIFVGLEHFGYEGDVAPLVLDYHRDARRQQRRSVCLVCGSSEP